MSGDTAQISLLATGVTTAVTLLGSFHGLPVLPLYVSGALAGVALACAADSGPPSYADVPSPLRIRISSTSSAIGLDDEGAPVTSYIESSLSAESDLADPLLPKALRLRAEVARQLDYSTPKKPRTQSSSSPQPSPFAPSVSESQYHDTGSESSLATISGTRFSSISP